MLLFSQTAFHYLGCILKGIFGNIFCLQLLLSKKRGWKEGLEKGAFNIHILCFCFMIFVEWRMGDSSIYCIQVFYSCEEYILWEGAS